MKAVVARQAKADLEGAGAGLAQWCLPGDCWNMCTLGDFDRLHQGLASFAGQLAGCIVIVKTGKLFVVGVDGSDDEFGHDVAPSRAAK